MAETILTHAAKTVLATDPLRAKYDQTMKQLLAEKPILALIIKYTVSECMDMSVPEIVSCIEGTKVESELIEPGLSNSPVIRGLKEEDYSLYESLIKYDIRTYIVFDPKKYPDKQKYELRIFINVEAQNDDHPGYDISTRGIFYACRQISAQCGTVFQNAGNANDGSYQNINKVYSIWICTSSADKLANTVEIIRPERKMYHDIISNESLLADLDFKDRCDILEVVIIRLSRKHDYEGVKSNLIKALTDLVNSKMSPLEKCSNLDAYGIPMTKEIERKVEQVSGFSIAIEKEEYAKGISQGITQGITQGVIQGTAKGKEEERSLLTKAFAELKAGKTADSLIAEGYEKETVETALAFLRG